MTAPVIAFFFGAIGWTFTEYMLHRFVFHAPSAKGPGAMEHRKHHAQVNYFAPWWQKALAAVATITVLLPTLTVFVSVDLAAAATTGFVLMYLAYEVLHRRAHTHPPNNRYGRWRRKHHFAHHFTDPRLAHGVTTPLWDIVFGTQLDCDQVRVPRRLAMRWLVDEHGEINAAYSADYRLVGSAKHDSTNY